MMILTMTSPEAHSTAVKDQGANGSNRCAVGERTSGISSISGSSVSLNSSCSSVDTSCTNATNVETKIRKRVSFGLQQTAYFSPEQLLTRQERKNVCWYSESELNLSRDEARSAIQALHQQLQMDAIAATTKMPIGDFETTKPTCTSQSSAYGNWVLRCPNDQTKIVCLRGIEKYADAAAKYAGQKRLVDSVLQQQSLNNEDVHVALVSRTLSQPFKEVARYYAMKAAEEIDISRRMEQDKKDKELRQREEVATVLLLIMGKQEDRQEVLRSPPYPLTPSKGSTSNLKETSPIVTPRGSFSGKRAFPGSPLSDNRNVKARIQTIPDR